MKARELAMAILALPPEQQEYAVMYVQESNGLIMRQPIKTVEVIELNRIVGEKPIRREAEVRLS